MILGVLLAEVPLLVLGILLQQPFLGAAAACGLAYLVLAYRHPGLGWMLVWLAFPFSIEMLAPGGHALYVPTEPMIALALLAWAARILTTGWAGLPRSSLHAPLAALGVVALLAALFSPYALLGLKAWIAAAGYVTFAYLYCLLERGDSLRSGRWIPWVVGSGALWGLYGAARVVVMGVSLPHAYGAGRPFFTEHGGYGAYLAMVLPLALLMALERRGRAQALYAAASLAIALGVILSLTRAAWVSLAIVLPLTTGLWSWWRRSLRPAVLIAALTALVLVVLAGIGAGGRVTRHAGSIVEREDASNLERLNRWMAAVEMVRDRPWLGVGLAAYPPSYPQYRRKAILTSLAYQYMGPHSEPFRLLSEMGVLGFLAAIWFLGAAAALGFRVFWRSVDPRARLLALALLAGLGTYAIHAIFRTYFDLEKVAVPFWAALGGIAALGRELKRP